MAGVYRPRHPERTVLYRVLLHHFDRFLAEYESRFEKEYGYFRPIVKEVVETLRIFFKFKRRLLRDLCRCALLVLSRYFDVVTGSALTPGIMAAIQTVGDRIVDHLKLTFAAAKPPPSHVFDQVALLEAEESGDYF